MHCIHDEFIKSDVFDPAPSFQVDREDPGGDNEDVCDRDSQNSAGFWALAPILIAHLVETETDAENCSDPAE